MTVERAKTVGDLLLVDDTAANLMVLGAALSQAGHRVRTASEPEAGLADALAEPPDLILLDIRMPRIDGFEVCRRLKADGRTRDVPVIFISSLDTAADKVEAFRAGGVDYVTKPFFFQEVLARVETHLALRRLNEQLEAQVEERTQQLNLSRLEMLWRLAKAGELRDEDTGYHVVRVGLYARLLAEQLGLPAAEAEQLFLTSPLHDVGKIGVPDAILLKPGRLTDDERAVMQRHCEVGAVILRQPSVGMALYQQLHDEGVALTEINPLRERAAVIAMSHHEKWDGTGYPQALAGEAIPLDGRIVALADVYDALSSQRPYKEAFAEERVLAILRSGVGSHFDPGVAAAFERLVPAFRAVRHDYCGADLAAASDALNQR